MTRRINFKFIAIALMATVTAAGIIGVLWILQTRSDAAHHVERAELAYAEENYAAAAASFRRALRRDPANKDYMRRYEDALLKVRPRTLDESNERYQELLSLYQHEAHHDQQNHEAHLRFIRELHNNARLLSALGGRGEMTLWQQLDEAANDMLFHVPENHEQYVAGRLYRGIARTQMRSVMTDEDLENALDDLREYVEANPDDDLGHAAFITGERLVARHIGVRLGSRRAEDRLQQLTEHIERALEAVPSGPEVQLAYVRYLQQQFDHREAQRASGPYADQLNRAIEDLTAAVQESGDAVLTVETSTILARLGVPGALESAISLLSQYVQDDPEALGHKYMLANFQARAGHLDAARELARELIDAEPIGVRFLAQLQPLVRSMAAGLMVDIEFQRWTRATSDEELEQALRSLEETRVQLERFSTDPDNDPLLIRADAKYELASGNYRRAASLLERLIRDGNADAEVLLQSSYALERIGEIGLAYERLLAMGEGMLSNPPAALLQQKAQLELRIGRLDDAQQTIERLQVNHPDYEWIGELERALQAAMTGEEVVDEDDPVARAIRSAQQSLAEGDTEAARAAVFSLLEDDSLRDVRLYLAAAQIEVSAGAMEQARPLVETGLEIDPGNTQLRQLHAQIETGDVIEAVRFFIEDEHADPTERDIQLMLAYGAMVLQQQRAVDLLEEQAMYEQAAESAELAERAERRAKDLLERLRDDHGDDPRVIDYEFTQSLRDRDWQRANAVLQRAENADVDAVDLTMYRGLMAMEQGEFADAIQAFQRATRLAPFSGEAWRALAMSYQRVGNIQAAVEAYEETYRVNPNNRHGLRLYLGLLLQIGEENRALRLLRDAPRHIVRVPEFRDLWLQLEGQIGDLSVAMRERQRQYQDNPADRRNAIQFALLLAQSEARPEAILDEHGERRFSSRRWSAMGIREQQRVLQDVAQEWRQQALEITDAIIEADGEDREIIVLKATLHRLDGQYEEGERLLSQLVDAQESSELRVRDYLQLAQYQLEAGRHAEAIRTANQAADHQSSTQRDAEQFVVNLFMSHNMHRQAIPYLERILEVNDTTQARMQWIECHLHAGMIDQAERELDRLGSDVDPDFQTVMLRAAVHRARMQQHFAAGEDQQAEQYRDRIDNALDLAANMMPNNPLPYIQRAHILLLEHRFTGRNRLLNEAMSALSEADTLRPGDPRTRRARIDVLWAMGNERAAMREAERLIEQSPENMQHHRVLVLLYREAGQTEQALGVAESATDIFPHSPMWQGLMAELHRELEQYYEAAGHYVAAYRLNQDPAMLRASVHTLREIDPVPYQHIHGLLREHSEILEQDLQLAGLFAYALHEGGRASQARRYMRDSYARHLSRIEADQRGLSALNEWFEAFNPVFALQEPQDAESMILELAGDQPNAYVQYWISRYWRQSGPEGQSRAVELLTEIADYATDSGDDQFRVAVLFDLAAVHYQMKNHQAALETFTAVHEIIPENPLVMNNIAFILAEYLDRVEEGWSYARRALEQAPDHVSILDTAGWIQFKRGNFEEAENLLLRSIAREETSANHLHLAHVLASTDRVNEAQEQLQRASELDPTPERKEEIERLAEQIRTSTSISQ